MQRQEGWEESLERIVIFSRNEPYLPFRISFGEQVMRYTNDIYAPVWK